jgi:hypothetical protein
VSVFKVKKSPYYQFDFVLRGHRFYGSTECTVRKEAEKFEAVEREKAKELVKAMKRSKASLLMSPTGSGMSKLNTMLIPRPRKQTSPGSSTISASLDR